MASHAEAMNTVCPVSRSLDVTGDRWSILILRELYMGATRFEEIQIQTAATPQMLTTRLKSLESDGMIERRPYSEKPLRHGYHLTEKGRAFYPVIHALRAWGETWCKSKDEGIAVNFVHRACGHDVGVSNVCPVCKLTVERKDLDSSLSDKYARERADRRTAFKAK